MLFIPKFEPIQKANPYHPFEDMRVTGENSDYRVKINGKECYVHSCRVSAMPYNAYWPGYQRDKSQAEWASFISFFGDERVTVEVECAREFERAVVRPLSKNVDVTTDGNKVTFSLEETGNYVFELDDSHFALHIFYSKPNSEPNPQDVTYYFGPGNHYPLLITLKDNESIYVHPEARVFTTVYAENTENIRIFGGGILNNSNQERVTQSCAGKFPIGNMQFKECKNVKIQDVVLMDSASWVCSMFNCNDVTIDNIKIVGQWRYNTDGIDLCNCSNVKVRDCFVRSFDDSICVKAINNHTVCENISVENCVCWCEWGKTLEIGLETAADEYKNISYKDCDLIHNCTAAITVSNGHYADIHNILYENINVEFQEYNRPEVLQESVSQLYVDNGEVFIPCLIQLGNGKFSANYANDIANEKDKNFGHTHNILFKNINVYNENPKTIRVRFTSESDTAPVEDVVLENLTVNGKKIESFDNIDAVFMNDRNVVLK